MSSVEVAKKNQLSSARPQTALAKPAVAIFAATLFCSALLMFLIQPMFAKLALPMYEREVVIPKPLLPLERKHFKYEFLFTIKEDNSVTLEVSRVIDPSPEMRR